MQKSNQRFRASRNRFMKSWLRGYLGDSYFSGAAHTKRYNRATCRMLTSHIMFHRQVAQQNETLESIGSYNGTYNIQWSMAEAIE